MRRLAATLQWDMKLQIRHGFYYAVVFVALILVLVLIQLPETALRNIVPALLIENMVVTTFYFIGGQVLLEKNEGSLEAQVITPLRIDEYLLSKTGSLSLLALIETLVIVVLSTGLNFKMLPLLGGVLLLGGMYCLYGFWVVARYDSINEYLMPSILYTLGFSVPMLDHFGLVKSWLFYLHPVQAPLVLMRSAFTAVQPWEVIYGVLYASLWVGLIYLAAHKAFYRFVVRKEGFK